MPGVRVGKVALNLRAPETARANAATLKHATAGRLLPTILARLERGLTARYGDAAVVQVRDVRLKLRLRASELASDKLIASIVDDLTAYIRNAARSPQRRDPAGVFAAPVQVFRNRAQLLATQLITAARRQTVPERAPLDFGAVWLDFESQPVAEQTAVLAESHALEGLREVVERAGLPALCALVVRLRDRSTDEVLAVLREEIARRAVRDAVGPLPSESPSDHRPPHRQGEPAVRSEEAAATAQDKDAPAEQSGRATDAAEHQATRGPLDPRESETPTTTEIDTEDQVALPASSTMLEAETRRTAPDVVDAGSNAAESPAAQEPINANGLVVASNWCGLFYLLNIANGIGLPEVLWRIGVSEGDALAAMLRLICADDDAAPDVLSPAFPRPPARLPPPQDWARTEFEAAIAAALGEGDVAERARIHDLALRDDAEWSLPAQGGAAVLALAEQALGEPLERKAIAARFALPGRIIIDDDRISVRQTVDAIDLDVRRAGLDADPGWLAWLKRDLVFVFDDAGAES